MRKLSPSVRISLGLVSATAGLIILADVLFGLSPDQVRPVLEARKQLTETLAAQVAMLANDGDFQAVRTTLAGAVERHPDVLSSGVRLPGRGLVATAGDHELLWRGARPDRSTPSHARVPIFQRGAEWGVLEVRFKKLGSSWWRSLKSNPFVKAILFICVSGFAAYLLFMRRALRHLDPEAVIPGRVRAALDTLAEGVVMIDAKEQIVLVNKAFEAGSGLSMRELLAHRLSSLPWRSGDGSRIQVFPWKASLSDGRNHTGEKLGLGDNETRIYAVNSSPVLDERGKPRGAMVTFDDLTQLEAAHEELRQTLRELESSRAEIQRQNQRLEILATRDPLTNCLNRGALNEQLDSLFRRSLESGVPMACIMADIDHFKSVNDAYGHLVGDEAIRFFASVLHESVRTMDVVGRYGGEEFCILLDGTDAQDAFDLAERLRETVESTSRTRVPQIAERGLTASFGVSISSPETESGEDLVNQADTALYRSKQTGRNRVTAWSRPAEAARAAG